MEGQLPESERNGDGAAPRRTAGQFGVIVYLASDLMLFAPFFAAYFLLRSTAAEWPPADVELDTLRAGAATVALVASSFTAIAAERAHGDGDRVRTRRWLLVTIALGVAFLANQLAEYATIPFRAGDHTYGSVYWGLTGLHTMHVLAGVCALGLLVMRVSRAVELHETSSWAGGIGLFWHLVDVVWLGVFVTIWIVR